MHSIKDRYITKISLSLYIMNKWHFVFPKFAYILLNYNIATKIVNVIILLKTILQIHIETSILVKRQKPHLTPATHTTQTSIFILKFAFDKHLINSDCWILTYLMYFYRSIGVSLLCFNFFFNPVSWVVCI